MSIKNKLSLNIKNNRTILIFASIGAGYALIFFLIGIYSILIEGLTLKGWFFSIGGTYYIELKHLSGTFLFIPVGWTVQLVGIATYFLGISGDGNEIINSPWIEKIIFPVIIILFWFFIGKGIGKVYLKIKGKDE